MYVYTRRTDKLSYNLSAINVDNHRDDMKNNMSAIKSSLTFDSVELYIYGHIPVGSVD